MGGATDLLQLIDDGVGFHVKNEMGKLLDLWLTKDDNLELWMSEDGGFPMWKKRVLITDLLAQAWENVCDGNEATECKAFDFLASATRIGHNMTIDGSNDAQIHLSGIANYSFSDKDGGEPGDDSELEGADVEDEDEADVPEEEDSENDDDVCGVRKRKERSGAGGAAGGAQEEEEEAEELWSDDDDERADDTADASTVAPTPAGAACALDGFEIVEQWC